jgi:hypothetical protein
MHCQYLGAVHEVLLSICEHAGKRQQGRVVAGCSHKSALQQALPACADTQPQSNWLTAARRKHDLQS